MKAAFPSVFEQHPLIVKRSDFHSFATIRGGDASEGAPQSGGSGRLARLAYGIERRWQATKSPA